MSGFSAADLQAHIPRLRRYARALTGSREAADDLTQDTLERAWHKRALWQPDPALAAQGLRAWLFALMHRVFLNEVRRRRPVEPLDEDGPHGADRADVQGADAAVVLRDLERALAQLASEQRAVVLLVGLEGLAYEEAAQVLEVPIGTVMSRLSRGRERLRQLLAAQDSVQDDAQRATTGAALRRVK
jgi:RNA polymerase sigma-70 factor (ECF subfamily)